MRKPFSPEENPDASPGYTIESVARALRLLQCFDDDHPERSLMDLAREVQLPTSTVFRLLHTLSSEGFVQRDPETGRYQLGLKLYHLGSIVSRRMGLLDTAHPHLEALCREVHETIHLAVEDGGVAIYLDKVEPERPVRMSTRIGKTLPLHAGALGKILLAYMAPERRREVISRGLTRFTEATITDPDELEAELARIRQRGYATDPREVYEEVCCVGAPLFDATGRMVAALSISGPSERFTKERIPELVQAVRRRAAAISLALGCGTAHADGKG